MLKGLLQEHGYSYTEVDVTNNEEAKTFLRNEGHRTVPQIYKDGELYVEGGFDGMKKYLETQTQVA